MRTIKGQDLVRNTDEVKFPFGGVKNQTDTEQGTPVIEEIYGDVLANIYKIISSTGINFTETQDSETTQFQFFQALKKFVNELNDKQQILTVNEQSISVNFNFDLLGDDYVFIGKASDLIIEEDNYYTLSGTGENEYPVLIENFIAPSSLVVVIINQAGTVIKSIEANSSNDSRYINVPFGTPLSFNDSNTLYYFDKGKLTTTYPKTYYFENIIREETANNNIDVLQVILFKKKFICFTLDESNNKYQAFMFSQDNPEVLQSEIDFADSDLADNSPYLYCDGGFIYITNSTNTVNSVEDDFSIGKFNFNEATGSFNHVETLVINSSFQKTTNVFISNSQNKLFTYIRGLLMSYDLSNENRQEEDIFFNKNGIVFEFNKRTYYCSDEIAFEINY